MADVVVLLAFAVLLEAVLIVFLVWPERPDDPGYEPRHLAGAPALDELQLAVTADKRWLRQHPAPWSQPRRH